MTTTPTLWTSLLANAAATTGRQYWPTTIGLANGDFLVMWTDEGDGGSPGADQFGRLFGPTGESKGPAFQLNSLATAGSETLGEIAALNDGGFVMAYQAGGGVRVERFNANGGRVFTDTLTGSAAATVLSVTALANGGYAVNFTRDVGFFGTDYDIFGVIYDGATNARGATFGAARNNGDDDHLGGAAGLAGGGMVTVYHVGGAVEFRIVNDAGQRIAGPAKAGDGANADVAALTNGNFVVVYERGGDIKYRVINPEGGASPELVAADGTNNQNEATVVALKDGGFFIAWDDDSGGLVNGRRFDFSGEPVGGFVQLASGLGADASPFVTTHPDLGLTSDGRILVSFVNASGEITEMILDPRDAVINGTPFKDTLTTQTFSSTVNAGDGDDTIFSGPGVDTINGEGGNDRLIFQEGRDSDHFDGGAGTDILDLGLITSRGAIVDLAANSWEFSPGYGPVIDPGFAFQPPLITFPGFESRAIRNVEFILGTRVADTLGGSALRDIFSGRGGDDRINGRGGDDILAGETGNDIIDGGDGADFINDGAGDDTVRGGGGDDRVIGESGADSIDGGTGTDTIDYSFAAERIRAALDNSFAGEGRAAGDTFAAVENVRGTVFSDVIRGDAAANFIDGHAGSDTIRGLGGNDTILSDLGSDDLAGGAGDDTFHYRVSGGGADTIRDFSGALGNNDRFTFVGSAFGLPAGPLDPARFAANTTGLATEAQHRFVYDTDDGVLRYDANGNGVGGTVIIAILTGAPVVTAADIVIV